MNAAFPFHSGDAALLDDLLTWIEQMGGCKGHKALLVADGAVQWSTVLALKEKAEKSFDSVDVTTNRVPMVGWIPGSNSLWTAAAEWFKAKCEPFWFNEPDCIPLKAGWLTDIESEYRSCGKPFMGAIIKDNRPFETGEYLEGNSVYPANAWDIIGPTINGKESWTNSSKAAVVPQAFNSPMVCHIWGLPDAAPTFVEKRPENSVNTFELSFLRPEWRVFHRSKDGSLLKLLRKRVGLYPAKEPVDESWADFVSLRRAGDIIALLPILKIISERNGRAVKLVVHSAFMPLLEGVSYVHGIEWKGDWESPLLAAAKFQAVNLQVFGKGVMPNTQRSNFAIQAWEKMGHQWNRHLPLVFDRRNPAREEELAAKVFKTVKPKILIKPSGFSSPFHDAGFVGESIHREFGESAEVVNLDFVKADRIFDLLGLMDRAACLVTIDTVTLWLAGASKCPMIQLVNGEGFGASPERGNCLIRVPYNRVRQKWPVISALIRTTICTPKNEDIVLTFSYFKPTDPDTIRRQDAAWATWPLLKARMHTHSGGRTSKDFGDAKAMPFVRDMITAAMRSGTEDIIVISNNDIKFDERLRDAILESCREYGCYWAYRVQVFGGPTDEGADVFAFTRCWWHMHQHLFPDFLLGYFWWDDILVRIMRWSGCPEQKRLYYHESHAGGGGSREHTAGGRHNDKLARQWLVEHNERHNKPLCMVNGQMEI